MSRLCRLCPGRRSAAQLRKRFSGTTFQTGAETVPVSGTHHPEGSANAHEGLLGPI
jgi:hypothetical protein